VKRQVPPVSTSPSAKAMAKPTAKVSARPVTRLEVAPSEVESSEERSLPVIDAPIRPKLVRKVKAGAFRVRVEQPIPREKDSLIERYRQHLKKISGAHKPVEDPDDTVMRSTRPTRTRSPHRPDFGPPQPDPSRFDLSSDDDDE
jgi:hypothetical protein